MGDIVDNADATPVQWPFVVKLKEPFDFAGERIVSLTFQRGTMGFLKGMPYEGLPSIDQLLTLGARMCGQPTEALALVAESDVAAVLAVPLGFFARCLRGGGTP